MKGEERNAERQREAGQCKSVAKDGIERADGKIGVLKQPEQREVDCHGERGHKLPSLALGRADRERSTVVECDLRREQQDEARLAPSVEQQRGEEQYDVLCRDAGRQEIK